MTKLSLNTFQPKRNPRFPFEHAELFPHREPGVLVLQAMEPDDPHDRPLPSQTGTTGAPTQPGDLPAGSIALGPATPVFSLSRQDVRFGDVLSTAATAWQRDVGTWVLAAFLYLLLAVVLPSVLVRLFESLLSVSDASPALEATLTGVRVGIGILQSAIQGVFFMGMIAMAIHALAGRAAPIGALFSQIPKAWKYVLQVVAIGVPIGGSFVLSAMLVFYLAVGSFDLDMPFDEAFEKAALPLGWLILLSAPVYLFIAISIVFAQLELAYNDNAGPVEAVIYSWRIARGKRWLVLGVMTVCALISTASILLCGIGILFGGPLSTVILVSLYLALRNGADVPLAETGSTLGNAASGFEDKPVRLG